MKSSLRCRKRFVALLIACCPIAAAHAQSNEANYDESKIPPYTLPDPLVMTNGQPVTQAKAWRKKRRPEILKLFETQVYGRNPGHPWIIWAEVTSMDTRALGGKATRKEVTLFLNGRRGGPQMDLLIYLPAGAQGPMPAFFGLNFNGNHAIANDPGITLARSWMRNDPALGIVNNRATEQSRGSEAGRWPVEKILARGYAVATICYGDIEPDFPEGWKLGVRGAFTPKGTNVMFAPDEWGAISAWAWGLSYAMDYLETDANIDSKRVALIGHSRLGKTALWAGAQDERFAIVISNDSGEGGAALARRNIGETVERINTSFPHWFCGNFKQYNQDVNALPVDQHMLLALIAPRPLYVASAAEDLWADPHGEFLSAKNAEPVYRLMGKEGLGVDAMPKVNEPVGQTIGYHIRTGKHDVTDYDWEQYLNFADRHFGR
jgi:hypothetical protein